MYLCCGSKCNKFSRKAHSQGPQILVYFRRVCTETPCTNTSTTNGCLCGRSSFARIINGEDVEQPGDFPWQAVLKTDGR